MFLEILAIGFYGIGVTRDRPISLGQQGFASNTGLGRVGTPGMTLLIGSIAIRRIQAPSFFPRRIGTCTRGK
jgi:hypothetical protein